jgi:Phenylalanine-4-hydroxylase
MPQVLDAIYIDQPYELYSEANHEAWRRLYARMQPDWERYANDAFLRGIRALCFNPDRIPRLADVNRFLCPLTGFQAKAVSGYIPAFLFFDCLRNREFPTTITIRSGENLDYLPEPDIFHDIAGMFRCTRPGIREHAGAVRGVRAHGCRSGIGNWRRAAPAAAADEHHPGNGPVLLVHD